MLFSLQEISELLDGVLPQQSQAGALGILHMLTQQLGGFVRIPVLNGTQDSLMLIEGALPPVPH